jgi:hypothetical protein
MSSKFIFIVVLFCSFWGIAQDANKEESIAVKKMASQSLNQKFSSRVLNAYQVNSKSKVEDLFSYFQLLTDANLKIDVKKEVIDNIHLLVQNPNVLVFDFTSDSLDKIPLQQFIRKLLVSEPIRFSISDEVTYDTVANQSWNTNYRVTTIKSGIVTTTKVIENVIFHETSKQFGNETKVVNATLLGAMN